MNKIFSSNTRKDGKDDVDDGEDKDGDHETHGGGLLGKGHDLFSGALDLGGGPDDLEVNVAEELFVDVELVRDGDGHLLGAVQRLGQVAQVPVVAGDHLGALVVHQVLIGQVLRLLRLRG